MPDTDRHIFKTALKWKDHKQGVFSFSGKPELDVASPPIFGGPEGVWSPQELYIASAEACTMTTFMGIVLRKGIEIESYESESEGVLETTDDGQIITSITIRPKVKVKNPEDEDKVRALLSRAHKYCMVANSMKTEVHVVIE